MSAVVAVEGLSKRYGSTVAVDDVSFEIGQGEIFGLLGRNGAGKTTMVECLQRLRRADRGRLRIGVVAPPWYEVPPSSYGGVESMCAWLVDGLVARGHEITLVGAGRGRTRGRFLRTFERPPSRRLGEPLPEALHAATAANLLLGLDLDVVHDFSFTGPLLACAREAPTLVTIHGDLQGELGQSQRASPDFSEGLVCPGFRGVGRLDSHATVDAFSNCIG